MAKTKSASKPDIDPIERGKSISMGVQNFLSNVGSLSESPSKYSEWIALYRSNNYVQLENMYQGSWLAKKVINIIAEDMTRGGLEIVGDIEPDKIELLMTEYAKHRPQVEDLLKWARLFGGAIATIDIQGQTFGEPLDFERVERFVAKGSFKGLTVFDRWVAFPNVDYSQIQSSSYEPSSYAISASAMIGFAKGKANADFTGYKPNPKQVSGSIDGSRCLRAIGDKLPWRKSVAYLFWGASVLEAPWDDVLRYEEMLVNISRLIWVASLRRYGVKGLDSILAAGGKAEQALLAKMELISRLQASSKLTVTDAEDIFDMHNYTFAGLQDVFNICANQIAGAFGIPLVRLLGISPAGLNATGDSDFRSYYDTILSEQEKVLQPILNKLFSVLQCHLFGKMYPIQVKFKSLWQLTDKERADIVSKHTASTIALFDSGIINRTIALQEIKQMSQNTNFGTNITKEFIDQAEAADADAEIPPITTNKEIEQ